MNTTTKESSAPERVKEALGFTDKRKDGWGIWLVDHYFADEDELLARIASTETIVELEELYYEENAFDDLRIDDNLKAQYVLLRKWLSLITTPEEAREFYSKPLNSDAHYEIIAELFDKVAKMTESKS